MIIETNFCSNTLGLEQIVDGNGPTMHMIVYLQVATISQALVRLFLSFPSFP